MTKMNRNTFLFSVIVLVSLAVSSCRQQEPIAYIADAQREQAQRILNEYTTSIHAGDQLHIEVMSVDAESVMPFNLETSRSVKVGNQQVNPSQYSSRGTNGVSVSNTYLVDEYGSFPFPILGIIHAEGLTPDSLSHYIQNRLRVEGYVKDATVNTRIQNFRVTVTGEVAKPALYHVLGERLTILEALALSGDMTIYGQRTNVKVIRSVQGQQVIGELDLTSYEFLDSPFYYLQPNDIVYVEPNKIKKKSATYDPNTTAYINIVSQSVRVILARSYYLIRVANE